MLCCRCRTVMYRAAIIQKEMIGGIVFQWKVIRDECGKCGVTLEMRVPESDCPYQVVVK